MHATKRVNMGHFRNIPDDLFQCLKNDGPDKLTLKLDGFLASFGRNASGDPFFESARSGPIYHIGAFEHYTISKNKTAESISRAKHYDALMEYIFNSAVMESLPKSSKVTGEFFYMPMATEVDNEFVKFVSVPYMKSKLGTHLTVFPYSGPEIFHFSTSEFKIISPLVNSLDKTIPNSDKDNVASFIINNLIGWDIIGPYIEGVVVHIKGTQWKIQSKIYEEYLNGKKGITYR